VGGLALAWLAWGCADLGKELRERGPVSTAAADVRVAIAVATTDTPSTGTGTGTGTPASGFELPRPSVDCTKVSEAGYRRGKRRAIEVITIDGRMIEQRTADGYWAMREAAAKDGIELTIFSAFRTHAEQLYFYGCYTSCACNSCAPAAKPGFSNHQSGHAIDIAMWPGVHDWLLVHADRFGFVATVKSEPWHWEYRPRKRMAWPSICAEV
jgi:D-alanyl-D-alanine carboxypeptidase